MEINNNFMAVMNTIIFWRTLAWHLAEERRDPLVTATHSLSNQPSN